MLSIEAGGTPRGDLAGDVARFEETFSNALVPCRLAPLADGFRIRARVRAFGPSVMVELEGVACAIQVPAAVDELHRATVIKTQAGGRTAVSRGGLVLDLERGETAFWTLDRTTLCRSEGAFRSRCLVLPAKLLAVVSLDELDGMPCAWSAEQALFMRYAAAAGDLMGDAPDAFCDLAGDHLADLAIATIARRSGRDDPTEGRGLRAVLVEVARGIVAREFADPTFATPTIARRLGVGPAYLDRLFEARGEGLATEIEAARVAFVRRRIEDGEAPAAVEDLARSSGFASVAALRKAWRRHFGDRAPRV